MRPIGKWMKRMSPMLLLALAMVAVLFTDRPVLANAIAVTTVTTTSPISDVISKEQAATSGGDTAVNDGNTYLVVKNGDASSHTITVTPTLSTLTMPGVGQVTVSTSATAVAAGKEAIIGPFAPSAWNNANGSISITYDAVTSVTIGAVRMPRLP